MKNTVDLHKAIERHVRKKFQIPDDLSDAVPLVIFDVLTGGIKSLYPNPLTDSPFSRARQIIGNFLSKNPGLFYDVVDYVQSWRNYLRQDGNHPKIRQFLGPKQVFAYRQIADANGAKFDYLFPFIQNSNRKIKNIPAKKDAMGKIIEPPIYFKHVRDLQAGELKHFLSALLGFTVTENDIHLVLKRYRDKVKSA